MEEFKEGPIQWDSPNGLDDALDLWVETNRKLVVALEAARDVVISTTGRILQLLPNCQPLSFPLGKHTAKLPNCQNCQTAKRPNCQTASRILQLLHWAAAAAALGKHTQASEHMCADDFIQLRSPVRVGALRESVIQAAHRVQRH